MSGQPRHQTGGSQEGCSGEDMEEVKTAHSGVLEINGRRETGLQF